MMQQRFQGSWRQSRFGIIAWMTLVGSLVIPVAWQSGFPLGAASAAAQGSFSGMIPSDPSISERTVLSGIEPNASEAVVPASLTLAADCERCNRPAVDCACPQLATCNPWWAHRSALSGEFLLLQPGNTDLVYALEQTSPFPAAASPTGPVGIVGINPQAGFRIGLTHAASDHTSLIAGYTWWQGDASSRLQASGGNVLGSTILYPDAATTAMGSSQASASQRIRFQFADVGYRHLWKANETMAVNWIGGLRYGNLSQKLNVRQVNTLPGTTTLDTKINFDGFGITGGLDFERLSQRSGLSLYGRSMASLMAGDWNAHYRQSNDLALGVIANNYEDFRVTPVLEAELGLAWTSPQRRCRCHVGMQVSGWYNAVSTREYTDSVRQGMYSDINETVTFNGLTLGGQWRF